MHFGFIFAMEEEAKALNTLFLQKGEMVANTFFPVWKFNKNNLKITVIISGIGKAAAAAATTILIEKYNVEAIINIGSAGGINCRIGDLIISNKALYHDVDVTAFGYSKGELPKQPLIFTSKEERLNLEFLVKNLPVDLNFKLGIIATGDQFINDIYKVNSIKQIHSGIKALEMEAASIAQVCHSYNKDFVIIKKISDLADSSASNTFKDEIVTFDKKISRVIKSILNIY